MKITIPYKFRRALALGAIAGGALVACSKENPTRDVELVLSARPGKLIPVEEVKNYAQQSDVRTIYIVPTENEWCTYDYITIQAVRKYLQNLINVAPNKVKGKGNFRFSPGEPSKIPSDSLWFIQHGWTLNQKQK